MAITLALGLMRFAWVWLSMTLTIFRRKRRGKAITVRPRFSILAVMALAVVLSFILTLLLGFEDMHNTVFYRSEDEAVEKIKLLQSEPLLAQRIARNGQEFAQSRYSFARVGQTLATEIQREMREWTPPSAFTRLWVNLRYRMKVQG